MPPTLITITGSLYHPSTGAKLTSGALIVTPSTIFISNAELVSTASVSIAVPGSGNLSFSLAYNGAASYRVEFDPTPSDTTTPIALKSGYFRNDWLLPSSGPVNIATL